MITTMRIVVTPIVVFIMFIGIQLFSFNMYVLAVAVLPGTTIHELCHFLFALILGGDPSSFSILPVAEGDYWKLGSVSFNENWFNTATIALAPLLMIPGAITFARLAMSVSSLFFWFVFCYMSAVMFTAALPSSQDVLVAIQNPASWPTAIVVLGLLTWVWYKTIRSLPLR